MSNSTNEILDTLNIEDVLTEAENLYRAVGTLELVKHGVLELEQLDSVVSTIEQSRKTYIDLLHLLQARKAESAE